MTAMIRGSQLARLLGPWQSRWPGRRRRPDYVALADARAWPARRRAARPGRTAAGRAGAGRGACASAGPRSPPPTVSCARSATWPAAAAPAAGPRCRAGTASANSGLWTPETTPDLIDLGCAALAAPAERGRGRGRRRRRPAALPVGGAGYHPTGLVGAAEAVAEAYTERGLPTQPEQIMVTSGVQHALDLVLRLLVPPGSAGAGRVADLSQRAGRASPRDGPGSAPTGVGPDRLGRRPAARRRAADPARAGLPDPGVPEPDRPPDAATELRERRAVGRARRRHRPDHRRVLRGPAARRWQRRCRRAVRSPSTGTPG